MPDEVENANEGEGEVIKKLTESMLKQQQQLDLLTQLLTVQRDGNTVVNGVSKESVEKRIRLFTYDPEEGLTADAWLARHDSIFKEDLKDCSGEEKARVAMRHVDDRAYNRIADYVRPKKVGDLTFDGLTDVMKKLFGEKKSQFEKRLELFKLRMSSVHCESLTEYAGIVNRVVEEACIKDMTPDQLKAIIFLTTIDLPRFAPTMFHVMNHAKTDSDLKLNSLLEVADRFITIQADSMAVTNNCRVNRIDSRSKRLKETAASESEEESKCESCGSGSHEREQCRYKNVQCHKCKKTGHIARVCRTKKISNCNRISNGTNTKQSKVLMQINSQEVEMEVDTGTCRTMISEETWKSLGIPVCRGTESQVLCANGTAMDVLGTCSCKILYGNQETEGEVIVVREKLNILGLDMFSQFFSLRPKKSTEVLEGASTSLHCGMGIVTSGSTNTEYGSAPEGLSIRSAYGNAPGSLHCRRSSSTSASHRMEPAYGNAPEERLPSGEVYGKAPGNCVPLAKEAEFILEGPVSGLSPAVEGSERDQPPVGMESESDCPSKESRGCGVSTKKVSDDPMGLVDLESEGVHVAPEEETREVDEDRGVK